MSTNAEQEEGGRLYWSERKAVARCMRRLYRRGLTTSTGGNVSCRVGSDLVAISAAGVDKANVRARDVALLRLDGENLTPELVPSSESRFHLAVYRCVERARAIVHAHPPTACAFACSTTPIEIGALCETYALLEPLVVAEYALSGTEELAGIVAEAAGRSSCVLLRNHAALTHGENLQQAFSRLELLEEAARLTLLLQRLEGVRLLSQDERLELDRLVGRQPGSDN